LLFRLPPVPSEAHEHMAYRTIDQGRGRLEIRILESSTALNDYLDWPGVAQVLCCTCQRLNSTTGEVTTETTYGVTGLHRDSRYPSRWKRHGRALDD
jgi:hypothetical protein